MTINWGFLLAIVISILYLITYKDLISLFTNIHEVADLAKDYGLWTSLYPMLAFYFCRTVFLIRNLKLTLDVVG